LTIEAVTPAFKALMALARPCSVALVVLMVTVWVAPVPTRNWNVPCVMILLAESKPCEEISWAWARLLTLKL